MSMYGRYGELASVSGRLICHVCGRDYLSLQSHVWGAHGYTADQYRQEFGIYSTTPLWAEGVSAKLTAANTRRMKSRPGELGAMSRRASEIERGRRDGYYRPRQPVADDVKQRIGESLADWWARVPADQRSAKGRELAEKSKAWWAAHPDAAAARAERTRKLGSGHKWGVRGSKNPSAKLTDEQVRELRKRYDAGENRADLAKRFGVSKSLLWLIATKQIWKHVA